MKKCWYLLSLQASHYKTEFQKARYATEEHKMFEREMEISLRQNEEEEDKKRLVKELELEEILAEAISKENKMNDTEKGEK